MKERNRLLWIDRDPQRYRGNYIGMFDLTKGIIMVEIILLHCINDYFELMTYDGGSSFLVQFLLSPLTLLRYGSVPMLFMICGYGIRRQSVKNHVRSQFKLFLFPYLCVIVAVAVCILIRWLVSGGLLTGELFRQVVPFFLGFHPGVRASESPMNQIGPVWFFLTYILSSIYLNLVLQEKQIWVQVMTLAFGTVAGLVCAGLPIPFCFQQTLICAGFLYTGIYLKKGKIVQQKMPWYLLLIAWSCVGWITRIGGLAEIANNHYRYGGMDLLIAYLAGIVELWLHQRLDVLQGKLADGLRWMGRHMMWLCCIHTVSYLMGPWKALAELFRERPFVGFLIEFISSFVYAVVFCLLIEKLLKKLMAARRKKTAA